MSEIIDSEGQGLSPATLGVKIPGGREQRKTGDLTLATQRQRERQQAAHAITDDPDWAVRDPPCCRESGFEPNGDVVGQIEMALLAAGGLPIDDERPQTRVRKVLQKAQLRQ